MPEITIPPTSMLTSVVTTQTKTFDKVWASKLIFDDGGKPELGKVSMYAEMLPYYLNGDTKVFASSDLKLVFQTDDYFAAVVNVPELLAILGGGAQAVPPALAYQQARLADWNAAEAIVSTARDTLAVAQAALTPTWTVQLQAATNAAQDALDAAVARAKIAQAAYQDPANPKLV